MFTRNYIFITHGAEKPHNFYELRDLLKKIEYRPVILYVKLIYFVEFSSRTVASRVITDGALLRLTQRVSKLSTDTVNSQLSAE